MNLRLATPEDVETIMAFRYEAAEWLSRLGSDQWSNPFPPAAILATIEAGETWMVVDENEPIATVTVRLVDEPGLWTTAEIAEPALYVHKLTVRKSYGGQGLGADLLDRAGGWAADENCAWLRLSCWSTNSRLHDYYRSLGFNFLRIADRPPSGALFQRPASPYAGARFRAVSRLPVSDP